MAVAVPPRAKLVGAPVKRVEDPRLITGNGQYLDDIKLPGMAHVVIVRSPHAHARILSINTEKARALPGVLTVITGADIREKAGPLPIPFPAAGVENHLPAHYAMATDMVRHTGEAVAAVVAENGYIARDASALIEVSYEVLPAVVDQEAAMADGAPQLHESAPHNICYHWMAGNKEAIDTVINEAEVVIKHRIRNQRLIPNPMETRGAIARYDAGTEELTLWLTSQAPHVGKLLLAAFVLGMPEHKLRVIAPEVGGGFGAKIFVYPDMVIMALLAKMVGRPIKWVETRSENYIATTHGRDHVQDVTLAARRDGTITGMYVRSMANLGAYSSTIAPGCVATLYGRMISGVYHIPHLVSEIYTVYTNTAMVDAYRGAGRPEATYVCERMIDILAAELKMDPVDVRRKNFIRADEFPYKPADLGMLPYDSGDYDLTLDKALEAVDYASLRQWQAAARAQGRLVGIGVSSYVEICGVAPSAWMQGEGWGAPLWESAHIRVLATGKIVATTGSSAHGQGHETTFGQLVADRFGVNLSDVEVRHGDTANAPFGLGTYGSRSLAVGGSALYRAAGTVIDKMKEIGAHMLEVAVEDVEYVDGVVAVKGVPGRSKSFAEIAFAAFVTTGLPAGMQPNLEATDYFDPPNCTFPFGTHISVVEIAPDTGEVSILRYVAADDVGPVINPMIVDGQLHGGIAQGIGQALYEGAQYDEDGQLLTGSLMDYHLPRATNLPTFETLRTVTPSPSNPMGVKGAGEAGTIASAPCMVNAVIDALSPLGIRDMDMPLTAQKIWTTIRDAQAAHA